MCCVFFSLSKKREMKMAGLLCTSSWVLLLILWLACAVEMRPSVTQDDLKVCGDNHSIISPIAEPQNLHFKPFLTVCFTSFIIFIAPLSNSGPCNVIIFGSAWQYKIPITAGPPWLYSTCSAHGANTRMLCCYFDILISLVKNIILT